MIESDKRFSGIPTRDELWQTGIIHVHVYRREYQLLVLQEGKIIL